MVSEDKKRGNLTRRVHKTKRESPQKQGFPGKKKGDRENLSPVYGGEELDLKKRHTNGTTYLGARICVRNQLDENSSVFD